MFIVIDSPALAAHVGIAVRSHCRQLLRDGHEPPAELAKLAEALMPASVTRSRAARPN